MSVQSTDQKKRRKRVGLGHNNPPPEYVLRAERPDPLAAVRMISWTETCEALNISSWTLARWIATGQFPRPLQLTPTSPRMFRVRAIAAHLNKRERARLNRREPRGAVKNNIRKAKRREAKGDGA
jgi:predicted DNA-binding transcriptional regulator AlpA